MIKFADIMWCFLIIITGVHRVQKFRGMHKLFVLVHYKKRSLWWLTRLLTGIYFSCSYRFRHAHSHAYEHFSKRRCYANMITFPCLVFDNVGPPTRLSMQTTVKYDMNQVLKNGQWWCRERYWRNIHQWNFSYRCRVQSSGILTSVRLLTKILSKFNLFISLERRIGWNCPKKSSLQPSITLSS